MTQPPSALGDLMTFMGTAFAVLVILLIALWVINGAVKMFNDLFR